MAIIIPSKNIFSKSFDPVIDNKIDKIEVTAQEPKEEKQYDQTIYQEDINDFSSATTQSITAQASHLDIVGLSIPLRAICGISGNYKKIALPTIHILLKQDKKLVTSVKANDIQWSVAGDMEFYRTNVSYNTDGVLDIIGSSKITPAEKTENSVDLLNLDNSFNHNVTTAVREYYKSVTGYDMPSSDFYQKAEYDYETHKTLLTAYFRIETRVRQETYSLEMPELKVDSVNQTDEYCDIVLQPVIYAYTFNLASSLCKKNTQYDYWETPRGEGYQITIVPTKINISVNGNTIVFDLTDKTQTINENGKNVFSFDGNELIQTTNTPSIESKYQGVVNEWKNGKQTAVISCAMADYYDENAVKAHNVVKRQIQAITIPANQLTYNGSISVDNLEGDVVNVIASVGQNTLIRGITILSYNNETITYRITRTNLALSSSVNVLATFTISMHIAADKPLVSTTEVDTPMVFHIGDIVIPYTYTNKGDMPMAYNRDFTPKQFKVVGTRISQSQGGTQELTLQEV